MVVSEKQKAAAGSIFLPLLLSLLSFQGIAQQDTTKTWLERVLDKGIMVLPVGFYSPETRFGGGIAGYYYFKTAKDSATRTSNVNFALVYTQNKQLTLQMPFEIAFKGNRWLLSGEIGYLKNPYRYYGVGNGIDLEVSELYTPKILRFKLGLLRQVAPNVFMGPKWRFERQRIIETLPQGLLDTQRPVGFNGATVSSLGIDAMIDRRNHIFTPLKGYYAYASIAFASQTIGSTHNAFNFVIDLRKYFPVGQKATVAAQFYTTGWAGSTPFFALSQMGGYYRMRGFFSGAYRDKHFTTAQIAFRYPLIGPLGGAIFLATGYVAPKAGFYPNYLRMAGGAGLRVRMNKKDNINLRLDYAIGKGTSGFYATVAEAF